MKADIDALMQAKGLEAFIVLGNAEHNPPMTYLTGGGHVANAVLIKKAGAPAVLYCNAMEREEAAKSGLMVVPGITISDFLKRHGEVLREQGITSGRVGVFGITDISTALMLFDSIRREFPQITLVGETREDSLFNRAMETKSQEEVARIRRMGRITVEVVGMTANYLTDCSVRDDEVLLKDDGTPLTLGDVRSKITLWLAERGADLSEGFIFAIGRDAGIPHSQGNPADLMRLGQTIVFDIYPREMGGGYFYDFTRTWSLGYATPQAQELYDQVRLVYEHLVENIDLNAQFKDYTRFTCEQFEKMDHPTQRTVNDPLEGFVHSLGHGVGLNIHERPWSSLSSDEDNILRPGVVVTIEPGLYYPDKGMGCRIEDTYWVRPDGRFERLAEYPYDFVLPMKNWKGASG